MSQKAEYFAARRWPALFAVQALAFLGLGLGYVAAGSGWRLALGVVFLALVPLPLWAAWSCLRRPVLVIGEDSLQLCHPFSVHRRRVELDDLGALKWSTRSFACFEHAVEGSLSLSLRELSRSQRADVLRRLGAPAAA